MITFTPYTTHGSENQKLEGRMAPLTLSPYDQFMEFVFPIFTTLGYVGLEVLLTEV